MWTSCYPSIVRAEVYAALALVALVVVGCGGGGGGGDGDDAAPTPSPVATATASLATPTPQATDASGFAIGALRFEAAGGVSVLRSEDGNARWGRVFDENAVGPTGLRVAFGDRQNGWLIDRPSGVTSHILHTTNGGASWVDQTSNIGVEGENVVELQDIASVSAQEGVAVGGVFVGVPLFNGHPIILTTQNGGANWFPATVVLSPDRPGVLTSVCLTQGGNGIAVGFSVTSGAVVVQTIDGGSTWFDITDRLGLSGADLARLSTAGCAEPGSFWVGGQHLRSTIAGPTLLHSSDGGVTWDNRSPSVLGSPQEGLIEVKFVDASRGWAVIEGSLVILHTSDAGTTWSMQSIPDGISGFLTALDFTATNHGVTVGALEGIEEGAPSALILTTQDGGATWNRAAVETADVVGLDDVSLVE